MTQYLTFSNPGELDMRGVTTFGVSVKERDDSIGIFGTGFKYAIAILLREGQTIRINSGTETHEFTTRINEFRNQEFDFIYMNGRELGFTTHYGFKWEMWQAYRELFCNCQDEGGEAVKSLSEPQPVPGVTQVILSGDKILTAHAKRDEVILTGRKFYTCDRLEVVKKPSNFVFSHGIRVMKTNFPSLFSWNILESIDLTEDRTVVSDLNTRDVISRFLLNDCTDEKFIRKVLLAEKFTFEHGFNFNWVGLYPSEHFISVVLPYINNHSGKMNLSAINRVKGGLPKAELKIKKACLTKVQSIMLERAKIFCKQIGIEAEDFPITVTETLGSGVLGLAKDGEIFLSLELFEAGTNGVAKGLVEEWTHLHYGCHDCSHRMQNIFLDKIISLGGELIGEPI